MNKINKYSAILYASTVVGLGTCTYVGCNVIKDKTISEKTVNIGSPGLIAYTLLWDIGAIGSTLDENIPNNKFKQNKLGGNLTK